MNRWPSHSQEQRPDSEVIGYKRRVLWISVILIGAFALLTLFWSKHRGSQPANLQAAEVPRAELILRKDRLYRLNDTNAFSGLMCQRYSDGVLQSRSAVVEGLLEGLSEGWFTNGQLQVTEHFKRGVSHGLRTKWYPSGKILSQANIVGGQFEGTFRKWHENGLLAEQIEFSNGQPAGVSLAYFESGFLKARARLDAGKVVEHHFWKDGEADRAVSAVDKPTQSPADPTAQ
jgi:antitoxin component YwqK of YwqJK toxin-antitoxin module